MAQSIQTSKFGTLDTSGRIPVSLTGVGGDPALGLGLSFNIGGKDYTFIPEDRITKGAVSGDSGALFTGFLDPKLLSTLQSSAEYVDLSGTQIGSSFQVGSFISDKMGGSTKGYLAPKEVVDPVLASGITLYNPSFAGKASGIGNANGKPAYILPSGYADNSGQVTKTETKITGYTYSGGGGLFGGLSDAFTQVFQPIEKTISTNLAQLDKDLSLSQNAPLIATIAATIALPGVGASIGNSLLSAGLLPVGTSVATATAVGTGLANAALQVAQGKSPEDALKAGVVGAAGGAVGNYLVGDPGTLKSFVTSTSTNLLAGKNPEDAVIAGIASSGAGLAGRTVAVETGSAVAGQVAAGTTAGLLTGKTAEQSLAQGVGNIKLDSLIPDSGVTVANEAQVTAGQQDLMNQLAPFEVDTTASAFDTRDIIDDNSGFSVSQPTTPITSIPTTSITGNTGGNMATSYTEDPYGFSGGTEVDMATSYSDSSAADPYALLDPVTGEYFVGADDQNYDPYTATVSDAIQDYAKGTGLSVKDVVKFFKDNPNLAKAATSVISGGVGLFGTKLATDTAREAARVAAEAQKFKPVGVTTRFGATNYTYDDKGNLATAGYTLTPELKAIQDKLMTGATLSLDEAKKVADLYDPLKKASASLFDLGTSYLAKTPEQVAADYMAKQQDLLAPSRERQLSQLQNTLFQTGRGGLSVGGTGLRPGGGQGLRAASPEMEAYYNALAQSDAALAAGAQQAGQQSVLFGKGLLGAGGEFLGKYTAGQTGAYDPFKSLLASAGTVESMGAGALDVGTALGGRTTTASSNAARTLLPTSSVNPYSSLFTSLADDPQFKAAVQSFLTGG
jgi:hypothetical protein